MSEPPTLPRARVVRRRSTRLVWSIPLVAVLGAWWLAREAWSGRGVSIRIELPSGGGLGEGDPLRYRDVRVGSVESVALSDDLARVVVDVRLEPGAEALARSGSRFWVVRPRVSVEGVEGLETIVGARYLTVRPGPPDAALRRSFVALADPPAEEEVDPEGIEVLLEADRRSGLSAGAPVLYRGIRVGSILAVGLSSDATSVEARAYVRPAFAALVRTDTRFFQAGGFRADVGLTGGLSLQLDSLPTLLLGGVALVTPGQPGPPAVHGQRFRLYAEAEEKWLAWRPALPVGEAVPGGRLPVPRKARRTWREGRVFARTRAVQGWVLGVSEGLLGPAALLRPAGTAEEDVALELGGERLSLVEPLVRELGGVALAPLRQGEGPVWPAERMRSAVGEAPEDCLVVRDSTASPLAIGAARMELAGGVWSVDASFVFDGDWHGACVVSRSDGRLIGLLLVTEGAGAVVPLPLDGR